MPVRGSTETRIVTRETCRILADKIFAMTTGGGKTYVAMNSTWIGGTRWARNTIHSGGERQELDITIVRNIRGASGLARTNIVDDDGLEDTVQRAEKLTRFDVESPDNYPDTLRLPPGSPHPILWFDATCQVDETIRARIAEESIGSAEAAKCLSAGYCQVGVHGQGIITADGLFRYYPYTTAQYSVTVRDPAQQGSGWAGMDHYDWRQIPPQAVAQTALEKCLRSRNAVAVEPGRYTVVLEPQAVCDLVAPLIENGLERRVAEMGGGPFADPNRPGSSRLGQVVLDQRLTLSADPMDPEAGFVPFDGSGEPYQRVTWIERGVLKELAYLRSYGVRELGKDAGLPNPRAFRLAGDPAHGTMTVGDMIANTQRGLLITRFNNVRVLDLGTMLLMGNTRDGVWLIERGKITKAVKNVRFTESPLFVLNNIEAIGQSTRVFRPQAPAVVPAIMARDFSCTGLVDAV